MRGYSKHFWELVDQLHDISRDPRRYASSEFDMKLREILLYVKSNQDGQQEFLQCFRNLVQEFCRSEFLSPEEQFRARSAYTWFVIPFCMRELQWPEVQEAISDFSKDCKDPSTLRILKHISSAYDNNWTYESSFPYYVEKALKAGRRI